MEATYLFWPGDTKRFYISQYAGVVFVIFSNSTDCVGMGG